MEDGLQLHNHNENNNDNDKNDVITMNATLGRKYKKLDTTEENTNNLTLSNLKDATKIITHPLQLAGTKTKNVMKGTAGAVKDVALGVYDGVTGASNQTRRERRAGIDTAEASIAVGSRLSHSKDMVITKRNPTSPLVTTETAATVVESSDASDQPELNDSIVPKMTADLEEKEQAPMEESSLHRATARTTKAMVSPIKKVGQGISTLVTQTKPRLATTESSNLEESTMEPSMHGSNMRSDISEISNVSTAGTNGTIAGPVAKQPLRWITKTTKKGVEKLRRKKKVDPQQVEEQTFDLPSTKTINVQDSAHVWNIQMNPTLEYLLHDTTIAIALFAMVLSVPTLRNITLVMQGSIPTSVYISWLLLAFAIGMEIGRIRGMRSVPSITDIPVLTKDSKSTLTSDEGIPTEISFQVERPPPTKEGYTLIYRFLSSPCRQVRVVFPKDATVVVQMGPTTVPLLLLGKVWSTLSDSSDRVRQAWEMSGFVLVNDSLMTRLLKRPCMRRKKLKDVLVEDQESSSVSGYMPGKVFGDIRINEMPAESLEHDVIEPCCKLRGMDVFLTETAEESMSTHPFLLKAGLRDKPTFMVNAIVQWANICLYFELPDWFTDFDNIVEHADDATDVKAIKRFFLGDDAYRNARLKILPSLVDGPLPIKIIAPPKKELTVSCNALPSKWIFHNKQTLANGTVLQPILEMEIDVISNSTIRGISAMLKRYIRLIALDLAAVIHTPDGQTEQEPEACLGLWRFDHIDVLTCPPLSTRQDQRRDDMYQASKFMRLSEEELAAIEEES